MTSIIANGVKIKGSIEADEAELQVDGEIEGNVRGGSMTIGDTGLVPEVHFDLRQAVDAFGAERVMWASDFSVNQRGECWADLLYGVLGCPELSTNEKEWVLGKSLRTWLDWQTPPPF